jgi:inhibitor of cysteine peptidase
MLQKILSVVVLFMVISFVAGCSTAEKVNLTSADKGDQVQIKSGGELVITLDGNPSTGYTWEAQDLDTTFFQLIGDPVFFSSNPDLVGSSGTITLTFKALQTGSAVLTLVYHRPWEVDVTPLDSYQVTVNVK